MKTVNEAMEKKYGNYPEKVLQFGEGNFLRAFVDWMIDKANRDGIYQGSIVLCQPIAQGLKDRINAQNGVYTLAMRGAENGQPVENIEVITSVSRCINPYENYEDLMEIARSADLEVVVSNTTEAGIAYHEGDRLTDCPPVSFPAKVTAFLYERYKAFNGNPQKGLLFLPVELIDNNGAELKRIVLQYAQEWELGQDFINWTATANEFTSTLVDRIVTGYPGMKSLISRKSWAIKTTSSTRASSSIFGSSKVIKNGLTNSRSHKTDANVIWTDDVKPYKKRKVRILNGAHTSTVLAAYLAGFNIVGDFMKDDTVRAFMNDVIYKEVIPTLDLPKEELESFAAAVNDRFANPYIKHNLLDIALNSCSKFNARCLPSLLGYVEEKGELPKCLTFSLAAFIKFYQGEWKDGVYTGTRKDGTQYPLRDDKAVIRFFADIWAENDAGKAAEAALSNKDFWSGKDLTEVPGLKDAVAGYLKDMEEKEIKEIMAELIK